MLSKFDPTMLVQFEAVKRRARTLAEQHLHRWMFQKRKATYTTIAGALMDLARWPAHAQMIGYEDAKELELEIDYVAPDTPEWQRYWSLYCQQRLAVKDGQSSSSPIMRVWGCNDFILRKKMHTGVPSPLPSMWYEQLPTDKSWSGLWSGYTICGRCHGIRSTSGACGICGDPPFDMKPCLMRDDKGRKFVVHPAVMGAEGRYEDWFT